jgi:hypothetical protein
MFLDRLGTAVGGILEEGVRYKCSIFFTGIFLNKVKTFKQGKFMNKYWIIVPTTEQVFQELQKGIFK